MPICEKDFSITVSGPLQRCNQVPPDTFYYVRPAIEGYTDGMLNPGCALKASAAAVWDGVFFDYTISNPCMYSGPNDPFVPAMSINSGKVLWVAMLTNYAPYEPPGAGRWWIEIGGILGMALKWIWVGSSPAGTGGDGTRPSGLTYTAVGVNPWAGGAVCGTTPATLKIISVPVP